MKIPYGIHDYRTIKTENYLYIDKTSYIEKLESIGKYLVFVRPRRFGKSLFTSMLYYYYDINSGEIFQDLFRDTYIGMNKTKESSSYYILKFDFSGISTEKEAVDKSFFIKVKNCIKMFINKYKLNIQISNDICKANEYLESFLTEFKSQADKQIYLLIDEYDHFANNIMTADINLFNEITGKDGFVRSFYEVFKTYSGTVIGRIFITGVTPITLDSLTSGFNTAKNLTKHEVLNEMMGFTEEEVYSVLETLCISKEHLAVLKVNYNGYLFSEDSKIKVYNSNMALYYLDSMILYGYPPKNLTDPNIISDYTKITSMFDLYKDIDDKKEIIHNILNESTISVSIIDKFNLRMDFTRDQFLSLMYYLGLLTVDYGYGGISTLKTPNYIIKTVYFEYYFHYLNQMLDVRIDVSKVNEAVYKLSAENNPLLFKNLIETMLKRLDNRDFIKYDEKYIKLLMVTYINLSKLYLVKTEYPVGKHYIDVALLPNHVFLANNYFIFEVKYISKGICSDKLLEDKRNEAIEQINKYGGYEEMINIPNLKKYIFIFVHNECIIMEEIQ